MKEADFELPELYAKMRQIDQENSKSETKSCINVPVCDDQGGYTLKGGWPITTMKKDSTLRPMDTGFNFPTKEELLKYIDGLNFCRDNNAIIVDGEKTVRG